jgi:hypothetical protein
MADVDDKLNAALILVRDTGIRYAMNVHTFESQQALDTVEGDSVSGEDSSDEDYEDSGEEYEDSDEADGDSDEAGGDSDEAGGDDEDEDDLEGDVDDTSADFGVDWASSHVSELGPDGTSEC